MNEVQVRIESRRYVEAYGRYFNAVVDDLTRQDALIGDVQRRRMRHQGGSRNIIDGRIATYPGETIEATAVLHNDVTRYGNLDDFIEALISMGTQVVDGQKQMMFRGVSEASDVVGNTVDGQGKPIDHEVLLDMLARLPWKFNEHNGVDLSNYTFVGPPEIQEKVRNLFATLDKHDSWPALYLQKLAEWKSTKRIRRLEAREIE